MNTLTDDRVASMRSSVMLAVDQDISRRGHRARRAIGLVAASVLVAGFGSIGINAVSHGEGGDSSSQAEKPSTAARDESAGDALGKNDTSIVPDEDRQVVTTGQINVTVKEPRAVAQQISAYVESIGGRVDTRTENGGGADASAFVTVRVPSTKVTGTIDRLKTYGTVDSVTLQNDDVTAQAKDLDARIEALQLSVDRLERIMSKSDTSSELIKAETALTDRQEQLESLQAERKGIADQVSLSTLSIDLAQTSHADSVEPGGFTGGLTDGWNSLVSTVNHIVEITGTVLPWAVIVLGLCGVYRLVSRRRGRS